MSGRMEGTDHGETGRRHRSLRRRVAVSCGTVFVVGAVAIRFAQWHAAVEAIERDVDLGLQARLAVLEAREGRRPAADSAAADPLGLPAVAPAEGDRRDWLRAVLDVGHRSPDMAAFRWFGGAWRRDGTPVRTVALPAGVGWSPEWNARLGTAWTTPDGAWRLAAIPGSDDTVLVVGADRSALSAAARREAAYQATTFAVWVPFLLGLVWLVLSRALAPLAEIAATARRIRSGDFDQRIDVARADAEVAEVVETVNGMLDRLDDVRRAQSRFNADVAHQLVNPVHAILLEANQAEPRGPAAAAAALGRIDGLARRIERVCETLLAYSRTAALDPRRLRPVDLEPIVAAAIERLEDGARARGIAVVPPAGGAIVKGDADLLEEVIVNLLGNAVDHGAPGDRIEVVVAADAPSCRVAVIDHGPGVAAALIPGLFEQARSGKVSGGHGIGLELSRRIARSHGGDLLHEPTPGGGATFILRLPAPVAPRPA